MSEWNSTALESPRVFFLRDGCKLADAGEMISRLAADEFRIASCFAFVSRAPIEFDASAAVPLLEYAAGKPIVLLVAELEFSIKTYLITAAGYEQLEPQSAISKVREADLLQLLREDGEACVLEAPGNYHFVTPSLTHTTRFIRVGDLLNDLETLDRIAFWLRPYLNGADAVLVDSWSIASLILRALQLDRLELPFDCLPQHPTHNSALCRGVVERLLARVPANGKIVAFVSISGSGKLIEHLTELLAERTLAGLQFACCSLFGFATENALRLCECFARLPERQTYPHDGCQLCAQGSIQIPIDPAAYHLKLVQEKEVLLAKAHADPARPFIERYRDARELFLVHRDDRNDGRHHAFDIDMLNLLAHPEFATRLESKLGSLRGKVDVIVAPNHDPGKRLAQKAHEALGCTVIIHDTLERSRLSVGDAETITQARKLLIVDDVVNSGSRLKRYIQSVREGHYEEFDEFHYLVALARPSSRKNLDAIAKSLSAGHSWKAAFHSVEELILPSWSKEECPWCREFDFLSRIARKLSRPSQWLSERLAKLRNRINGIADEPLLLLPGVQSVTLADGSPLCSGGASSMVAVFVVASALQIQRGDDDLVKRLQPGFPVGNVMSPKNVSDRYTEGLIRAALLRLVRRAEWGYTAGVETRDLLVKEMAQANQKIIAGELLFAFGRAGLPPISSDRIVATFSEFLQKDLDVIASTVLSG